MNKRTKNYISQQSSLFLRLYRDASFRHIFLIFLSVTVGLFLLSWRVGFYQEDWWLDVLVEAHGMWFDILILGILLTALNVEAEKKRDLQRYNEEIEDFLGWKSEGAAYRVAGNVRRINRLGGTVRTLEKAYLINAKLSGVNLEEVCLANAILLRVNLSETNLRKANLAKAILSGASLAKADLSGAYLFGANLENTCLTETNFASADLSGANLKAANLTGANLKEANLSGANLDGAILTGVTAIGAIFPKRTTLLSEQDKADWKKRGAIFL